MLPPFAQELAEADPDLRRRLIAARPATVGEAEVNALAEQARATARVDPARGLRFAESAAELAEALGEARGRALAARGRAVALWAHARWSEAVRAFEEGIAEAEAAGDPLLAAQIPILQVETLARLGRHTDALALAASLAGRLRSAGSEEDAVKVDANAGNIYYQREEYAAALACWERALAWFEARGQEMAVASLRVNVGNALTHLHRLAEAREHYEAVLPVLEAAGVETVAAGVEGNLAFLHFLEGRYTEALREFARARQRFEALALAKDLALCDRKAAEVHLSLRLLPEAREAYERVLPQFHALEMADEAARCELGLALVLAAQGDDAGARAALDRAQAAFTGQGNEIGAARVRLERAEWLARRLAEQGPDPESARIADREAAAAGRVFRKHGFFLGGVQARLCRAEIRIHQGESPVRMLRALRAEAEAGAAVTLLWRVEAALARAHASAGRERAAVTHYRRAVAAIERARHALHGEDFRIAFLHDKLAVAEELLARLLDRGTPAALREAFALVERTRSRTLAERLAAGLPPEDEPGSESAALLRRLHELRSQLSWDYDRLLQWDDEGSRFRDPGSGLPEQVRRLELEYRDAERAVQLLLPQSLEPAAGGLSVPEVQALLAADERLVEYVATGDELLAFVVGPRSFRVARGLASLGEVSALAERLRGYWNRLSLGGSARAGQRADAVHTLLCELHELLLEPLTDWLDAPRLTVVTGGALHGVPFHALGDGETCAGDRWEMAYAPSAAVLRACRLRPDPESSRSLVFGLPDPDLSHVTEELAALRALLLGAEVREGAAATVDAVPQEGEFRYLHFATHAVFRQDSPYFSGLRMADGWLIAHDLLRRRLDCRMATLSACRTGMAAVAAGEEPLGLVRSFLRAGARAVLVSLWAADDRATAALMRECYQGLAAGQSRASALRQAQRVVRKEFPHPYHWAPFALVGAR